MTEEVTNKIERNDFLKLFAIIIMLVDHMGAVLLPEYRELRVIGRLAFPIFAYFLAIGYQKTSNLNNYLFRLFVFALLSQLPYSLAFQTYRLNIFFTLFVGLYTLDAFSRKRYAELGIILGISIILNQWIIGFDYGTYGLATILAFHILREDKLKLWIALGILNIAYIIDGGSTIQFFSIFSLLFINNYHSELKLHKYFFYVFYPAHILILFLIKLYIM